MYYRRKLLLGLLQEFGNHLDKTRLQKLLFLLSRFQKKQDYYFVPYKYGCYSFQSMADVNTLVKYNIISLEDNEIRHITELDYLAQLKITDRQAIKSLKQIYGLKTSRELVKSTYLSHPYYAINSTIAKNLLNEEQYARVIAARPVKQKSVLFTIGYEGRSLEEYLNKLIQNDVRLLCDVRNNALSMKFGFSKGTLQKACESVGVKYMHLPEVGIKSQLRQELNKQSDYDALFEDYKNTVLIESVDSQEKILELLHENHRIALTCFEADICQCHRKPLAEAISKLKHWDYELRHI
ncbi:uncharacterized protein (DUF488 family) [Pedobacter sp. CAN_A7]|uniref:DUF488 domain-containing protein n=1 Tax=Pedobacter sp. CAN_A7 TaxID=2787722 RepID=UPI0018CB35A7